MIRLTVSLALFSFLLVSSATAQTRPAPDLERALFSSFDSAFLDLLPTSGSPFAVLETLHPIAITDRFASGGLFVGQPSRMGGFLPSWTQTDFLLEGVSLTDPSGSGMPLLFPDLSLWRGLDVAAAIPVSPTNSSGLVVTLHPRVTGDRWIRSLEGAFSHGGMIASAKSTALAPPVSQLEGWDTGAFVASGPISPRIGATFAVSSARGSQIDRGDAAATDANVLSLFSRLAFAADANSALSVTGWFQRRESPVEQQRILSSPTASDGINAVHVQSAWDRHDPARLAWHVFAGYTSQARTPDLAAAASGVAERLVDGPVSQFSSLADESTRVWSAGASVRSKSGAPGPHSFGLALDVSGASMESSSFFGGTIGELVHGTPGRIWVFQAPATASHRGVLSLGLDASDHMTLGSRARIHAGFRFEIVNGSADGGATSINWRSALPRVHAHVNLKSSGAVALFGGYGRSADRLLMDYLAFGDPNAPTADVYRWNAPATGPPSLSQRGPLVARAGPGTGGNSAFSSIDPDLSRPVTDEFIVGIETHPGRNVLFRMAGVSRIERHLLGLTNPGAPAATAYSQFTVLDPGADVLFDEDDQLLTVFNRLPASFGQDRYVLTNTTQPSATFNGVEITLQVKAGNFLLTGGGTAGISLLSAAALGYGPLENDQTVIGDRDANPNAGTLVEDGRPFTDRAFTGKLSAVYHFPGAITLGAIARYQDGQPFTRSVVFPNLNQGAEAVRAFTSGDSRFLYVGTLDLRLQKRFGSAGRNVDVFVDAYNALNMANSVEEDMAAAPDDRVTIATQPPLAIHIGARITF